MYKNSSNEQNNYSSYEQNIVEMCQKTVDTTLKYISYIQHMDKFGHVAVDPGPIA